MRSVRLVYALYLTVIVAGIVYCTLVGLLGR
jgi:hypothetical protein